MRVLAERNRSARGVTGRRRVWSNGDRRVASLPVEVERRKNPDRRKVGDRRTGAERRGSSEGEVLVLPAFSIAEIGKIQELMATPGARVGCPICDGVLTLDGPRYRGGQAVWTVRCAACMRSMSMSNINLVPGTA